MYPLAPFSVYLFSVYLLSVYLFSVYLFSVNLFSVYLYSVYLFSVYLFSVYIQSRGSAVGVAALGSGRRLVTEAPPTRLLRSSYAPPPSVYIIQWRLRGLLSLLILH